MRTDVLNTKASNSPSVIRVECHFNVYLPQLDLNRDIRTNAEMLDRLRNSFKQLTCRKKVSTYNI